MRIFKIIVFLLSNLIPLGWLFFPSCISLNKNGTNEVRSEESISDLLETGYTIRTPKGSGSGTLFKANGKAYILTAGHVAEGSIIEVKNKMVEEDDNYVTKRYKKEWDVIHVEKTVFDNKLEKEKLVYDAKVIVYSPAEDNFYKGLDIAVLELYNPELFKDKKGATFTKTDNNLTIGSRIYHVGSLWAEFTESYVEGYVCRFDYKAFDTSFTVVKLGGCPGSSGGGIFNKENGKYTYCGMLTRGDPGTTSLIKPSYILRKFLIKNNLEALLK